MSIKDAINKGYEMIARKLFHKPLRPKPSEFRTKKFKYHEFTVYLKYLNEDLNTLDRGYKDGIYICFEYNHPEKGNMMLPIGINGSAIRRKGYTSPIWIAIRSGVRAMRKEIEKWKLEKS